MRTARSSFLLRTLAAAICLAAAAASARAEDPKVKITAARIGLPPGGPSVERDEAGAAVHACKFAAWAPVYVDLQVLQPIDGPVELVVEAPDADEIATTLAVPVNLAGLEPGTSVRTWTAGLMPYLRPAGMGEVTIHLRSAKGAVSEPFRIRYLRTRDASVYLVLSLGNRLPGFELPKPAAAPGSQTPSYETAGFRGGKVELAAITNVDELPDQWFGYDAADLVVLTTSSPGFLDRLFGEKGSATDKLRRAALLEWVRRGGRLVVSVGTNASAAVGMAALQDLLPYGINPSPPTRSVEELSLSWQIGQTSLTTAPLRSKSGAAGAKEPSRFPVANLTPKPGRGRVVMPPPSKSGEPIAAQGGYGLGRVTVVALDLDRPPFTELAERGEFWDWVLRECGAFRASVGQENKPRPTYGVPTDEENEVTAALRTHLDTFDGVPVISFGWVAVFIGLYILVIGPIEYYFLKRVLGRLELTWVTFPVIVLTVSAAAYFTAYAVKGRDLKVNKVDVIEVVADFDAQGKPTGRVYGTTWFTLFSPRIDSYVIGVTPAEDLAANPTAPGGAVLGWVGAPRLGGGRTALVRRRYAYHVDQQAVADGLEGVPVQVWSTKSFTANWAADMNPAVRLSPDSAPGPLIESRLEHPPGGKDLVIGTFVNRLPFPEITDCVAFYGDKAYPLGTILAGTEVRLVLIPGQGSAMDWLQKEGRLSDLLARAPASEITRSAGSRQPSGPQPATPTTGPLPLWGLLFHEAALKNESGSYPRNASLRRFDQTWRLKSENRTEVIIVGRVVPPSGPAGELFGGRESPTRLWLKGLPQPGETAPEVPGTGRQETYVRVYLPIKTTGQTR
jgi:hypothetical protein